MPTTKKQVKIDETEKLIKEDAKKALNKVKAKKETIEKTVENEAEKLKKTVAKTEKAVEKSIKKTPVRKSVSVFVQYQGREVKTDDLVEKAKSDFAAAGNKKTDAKDIKIYIKPEESMVYYVINDDFMGSFEN